MNDIFQEAREFEVIATFTPRPPLHAVPGARIHKLKEAAVRSLVSMQEQIHLNDPLNGPRGDYSILGMYLLGEIELLITEITAL